MSSISLKQETQTSLQQQQQLLINLAMRQAFHVLQLPLLELSEWLSTEIENNPVLEIDFSKETFKESFQGKHKSNRSSKTQDFDRYRNELPSQISLYEHLMNQVPMLIEEQKELEIAKLIIGHLNEKGYLETPLGEIASFISLEVLEKVLNKIQTLDPPGIAARNLQECLILQLQGKEKTHPIALQILNNYFDDLLHNRVPLISKQLNVPIKDLVSIIKTQISPLDLHPGYKFAPKSPSAIIPDISFVSLEGKWQIEVNSEYLPHFQIVPHYFQALRDQNLENEEYFYIRRQIASGKWLKRIVARRNQTLLRIGAFLLKNQRAFFDGDRAGLIPLTLKDASHEIGLHESTIAKATAGKYLACPFGMYSLKTFFKQAPEGCKLSNHSLRALLAKAISEEDKQCPMSDDQLAKHFDKLGMPIARRTITKYRTSLRIAPACRRRKWAKLHSRP